MTREEAIRQAGLTEGEKYWLVGSPGIEKKLIKRTPLEMFMCGANWADAHPVNPWHKVSEELPKERAFLVRKMGKQPIYKTLEYSSERDGFWTSSGGFITRDGVREYFTHWMPIPE